MAIITMQKSFFIAVFTVTISVKISSSFLIPTLEFGGCNIQVTLQTEEDIMVEYSSICKNQTSTLNMTHGAPQDCTNKCLFELMGVFDSENKLNVKGLQTFYETYTNATSGQIEELSSLHESCNVETSKTFQTLKETSNISVGNCRYYWLHESCIKYKFVSVNDTLKLC